MVVDVTTGPKFSAGKPKRLFEGQYVRSGIASRTYDVSSDGQRFLMIKRSEETASAIQINVVVNWFEKLKQRVPVK